MTVIRLSLLTFSFIVLLWSGLLGFFRQADSPFAFLNYTTIEDGRLVAYRSWVDGSHARRWVDDTMDNSVVKWSLDGQQIAFMTASYDEGKTIYVMRPNGENRRAVMQVPRWSSLDLLDWSPDGKHLLVESNNAGTLELYRVEVASGENYQLTDNPKAENGEGVWSPDGAWIAYIATDVDVANIHLMRWDGSDQQQLTFHPNIDRYIRWSPDSEWLAFTNNIGGKFEAYRMRRDGSDFMRLTHTPIHVHRVLWSTDSRWIYFTSQQEGVYALGVYRVGRDDAEVEALTDDVILAQLYDWFPNHGQIMLLGYDERHSLMTLHRINPDGSGLQLDMATHNFIQDVSWSPMVDLPLRVGWLLLIAGGLGMIGVMMKRESLPTIR